jgi:hypothetical protein
MKVSDAHYFDSDQSRAGPRPATIKIISSRAMSKKMQRRNQMECLEGVRSQFEKTNLMAG